MLLALAGALLLSAGKKTLPERMGERGFSKKSAFLIFLAVLVCFNAVFISAFSAGQVQLLQPAAEPTAVAQPAIEEVAEALQPEVLQETSLGLEQPQQVCIGCPPGVPLQDPARVEYRELTEAEAKGIFLEKISEIRAWLGNSGGMAVSSAAPEGSAGAASIGENLNRAETLISQERLEDAIEPMRNAWEGYLSLNPGAGSETKSAGILAVSPLKITTAYMDGRIWVTDHPARFAVVVRNNSGEAQEVRVGAQPKSWYITIDAIFGLIWDIYERWEPLGEDQNKFITLAPYETKKVEFEFTVASQPEGYKGYPAANIIFIAESLTTSGRDEYHLANSMYKGMPYWDANGNELDGNISLAGIWGFSPSKILSPTSFTIALRNNNAEGRNLEVFAVPKKFEGAYYRFLSPTWGWYYTDIGEPYVLTVPVGGNSIADFSSHVTYTTIEDTFSGGWSRSAEPLNPMGVLFLGFDDNRCKDEWLHGFSLADGFKNQANLEIISPAEGASFYGNGAMNVVFSFKDENWGDVELPPALDIEYRLKSSDSWSALGASRKNMLYYFNTSAPAEVGSYALEVRADYGGRQYSDSANYTVRSADFYIEWIKPIQVVEDVPLVEGKATVVRVKVVNTGPPNWVNVAINYNGWDKNQNILVDDSNIADFYPPNRYTVGGS